jgi:hypothetical protein
MVVSPILIIAYNRPQKLRSLIRSLRVSKPPNVMVAIDGPKLNSSHDRDLVHECQRMLDEIDWNCRIQTRIREANMGLSAAYVDAVNWAISTYGRVTVIEDDVIAGPELVPYSIDALERYKDHQYVGSISGYNFVPESSLTNPTGRERLSIYPVSYTWSTWERAWSKFDPEINWGRKVTLAKLAERCGGKTAALKWKLNFSDAVSGRVDTWDYAWVASLWEHNLVSVISNRNLAKYCGFEGGTHTTIRRRDSQLPIGEAFALPPTELSEIDRSADKWESRYRFNETRSGLLTSVLASSVLEVRRRWREN